MSASTLKRSIQYWLKHPPAPMIAVDGVRHIICDGTFLDHRPLIYAVMDARTHRLVYAAYGVAEHRGSLLRLYQMLADHGLELLSATTDGKPQQIKGLRHTWPSVTLQRCLVHVQRQGLSWCRRHPKRTDAKHLREIFLQLFEVKTQQEACVFLKAVETWERRFGPSIDESTDRGWVFSDLLRARSMLLKALPDLFHFTVNDKIPSTTNTLESYFSRLKEHYHHHRGLAPRHRDAYFRWYFYLVPR